MAVTKTVAYTGQEISGTLSGKVRTEDAAGRIVFYDANNVPYGILGLWPDGEYGLIIAKPGTDVFTLFS